MIKNNVTYMLNNCAALVFFVIMCLPLVAYNVSIKMGIIPASIFVYSKCSYL